MWFRRTEIRTGVGHAIKVGRAQGGRREKKMMVTYKGK